MNHAKRVEELKRQVIELGEQKEMITLNPAKRHSNTTRSGGYKQASKKLCLAEMNHILSIDPVTETAVVEPGVTMDQLAKVTIAHHLIPKVLPEFKGISIGGAIMGAAIESSSHRFGQFNDICSSYEVIQGDGKLIKANKENNADLFYGMPGTYGSLGLITATEVQLMPAKPWVKLRYHRVKKQEDLIEKIRTLCRENPAPDYIEGVLLSKANGLIIEATMEFENETRHLPTSTTSKRFDDWFVQHLKSIDQDRFEERMPLYDYLFRYDKGAFWMGYFVLRPQFLWRHIFKKQQWLLQKVKKAKAPFYMQSPHSLILPRLFGEWMNSQRLYASLHAVPENWFAKSFVVQDFYLPEDQAHQFTKFVNEEIGIYPLWFCPVKGTKKPQYFCPHYGQASMYINVGVYGIPITKNPQEATRCLEIKNLELGGRKMLYSQSYYDANGFWNIYPKNIYDKLRLESNAEGVWIPLDKKVLTTTL